MKDKLKISESPKKRKSDELQNNMEYFCSHHSELRHKEWQKENVNTEIREGDHVKISFPAITPTNELTKEWMWIEIFSIQDNGNRIIGKLDNEPVYITKPKVKFRQTVITFREEVSDLIRRTKNWRPGV